MENTQKNQHQTADQIYGYTYNLLIKENKSSEEVKAKLVERGIDGESASAIVENLLVEKAQKKEEANKDMLYGALWCIGGIVGTMANIGFIFWGAIIFGGIQFVKGLINSK